MTEGYKVKKIYLGNQLVWPDEGWKPSSSTVVYFKFDWDVKDYSWNNYNLTIDWWTPTYHSHYITIGWHRLYNSSSSITWDTSSDYTVVAWLRNFQTGRESSLYRAQAWILSAYTSSVSTQFSLTYLGVANGAYNTPVWTIMWTNALWTYYTEAGNNSGILITWSDWICVVVTLDRNGNVTRFYKNWNATPVFTKTSAGLSTDTPTTWIQVGIVWGTNWGWNARYYYGDMWEIILEKRMRSTDEISKYYNSTKGNYGL